MFGKRLLRNQHYSISPRVKCASEWISPQEPRVPVNGFLQESRVGKPVSGFLQESESQWVVFSKSQEASEWCTSCTLVYTSVMVNLINESGIKQKSNQSINKFSPNLLQVLYLHGNYSNPPLTKGHPSCQTWF